MVSSVSLACANCFEGYFEGFDDVSTFDENDACKNILGVLKIISYFTIVMPLFCGLLYGVYLLIDRVTATEDPSSEDQRMSSASRRIFGQSVEEQLGSQSSQERQRSNQEAIDPVIRAIQDSGERQRAEMQQASNDWIERMQRNSEAAIAAETAKTRRYVEKLNRKAEKREKESKAQLAEQEQRVKIAIEMADKRAAEAEREAQRIQARQTPEAQRMSGSNPSGRKGELNFSDLDFDLEDPQQIRAKYPNLDPSDDDEVQPIPSTGQ